MKLITTATLLALSAVVIIFLGIEFIELNEDQLQTLVPVSIAVAIIAMTCFITGEITGNYSQVDKLWSLLPIGYGWYFAIASGLEPRPVLMAILISLWGIRLTLNFIRRGGYSLIPWKGDEDYRWEVIRNNPFFKGRRLRMMLFNLLFICYYQNILIFLFSSSPLFAGESPLNYWDGILSLIYLGLLITETIADQQQYDFQTQKYRLLNKNPENTKSVDLEVYREGFVKSGLWKYSRHPNYACEQGVWIVLYLISVIPSGSWINPSGIGIILLMLLFYSSSNFSESISAQKYPKYREYMEKTPRFIPNFLQSPPQSK